MNAALDDILDKVALTKFKAGIWLAKNYNLLNLVHDLLQLQEDEDTRRESGGGYPE